MADAETELGTLYLVPTPIGNPRDVTLRALDVLGAVSVVAAEDTRKARTLLRTLGISASLLSYYDFNEDARSPQLLGKLRAGQDVALITDAGTPLVNDPGFRIVADAIAAGVKVCPLPGPSAVLTALVGSGLPAHRFDYLGFLPRKRDARLAAIGGLAELPATLIIFEAPHRLLDTLADLREVLGDRPAALARNLTKAGEEFLRGTLASVAADLADRGAVRGEYTVLVAGAPDRTTAGSEELADRLAAALARAGMTGHAAREVIMEVTGLPRNQVYGRVQAAREQAARSQAGQA